MVASYRLKIFMSAHSFTDAKLASALGVSHPTIKRYRTGKWPVSKLVGLLLQQGWPEWWDFLTEASNQIPTLPPERVTSVRNTVHSVRCTEEG